MFFKFPINIINYIDGFFNIIRFLLSWVSTPLDHGILFFTYCQIQVAKILLKIFAYMSMSAADL